jgi:non-heme chloroperoxidase
MKLFAVIVIIMAIGYFGAAFALTMVAPAPGGDTIDFSRLAATDVAPAPLVRETVRDGARMSVAHYPAATPRKLILLHGSGWHGRYLAPAARYFADNGLADVYAPNIRGHYGSGPVRGDIDHVGQLEEDIADLIAKVRADTPDAFVVLGGHSSGGALAIRFAHSPYADQADAYLLMAPFLGYKSPTYIADAGGWAKVSVPRIIGLSLLDRVGIHVFDYLPTLAFNLPEQYRDGTETLTYSYRLMTNINLHDDYEGDIAALPRRTLVLVGRDDEAMKAAEFPALFERLTEAQVRLLDGVGHLDLVSAPAALEAAGAWLKGLPERR